MARKSTTPKYVLIDGIQWTPALVKEKILTRDDAVKKALLRLYSWQTEDEKQAEQTQEHNKRGFNGVDSEILTSFAKQLESKGWLSPKQIALARKKILKYSTQIFNNHILANREKVYNSFGV